MPSGLFEQSFHAKATAAGGCKSPLMAARLLVLSLRAKEMMALEMHARIQPSRMERDAEVLVWKTQVIRGARERRGGGGREMMMMIMMMTVITTDDDDKWMKYIDR